MHTTNKTIPIVISLIAMAAIGAGKCPTVINAGPCKPSDDGPFAPACVKKTCSSNAANAQACWEPHTSTKPCEPGTMNWACTFARYPATYNLVPNDRSQAYCTGPDYVWTNGVCYTKVYTGCDLRYPAPGCGCVQQPCDTHVTEGTCSYDTQWIYDHETCIE